MSLDGRRIISQGNQELRSQIQQLEQQRQQQQVQPPHGNNNFSIITHPYILKRLKEIDNFNGERINLENFLNEIDNTIPLFVKYDVDSQKIILDTIKNKFTEKAKILIQLKLKKCNDWDQIKTLLKKTFENPISESKLYEQLLTTRNKRNINNFHYELTLILNDLNLKISSDPFKEIKLNAYNASALRTFIAGLPDYARGTVISQNFTDIDEALKYLEETELINTDITTDKRNYQYFDRKRNFHNNNSHNNNYHNNNFHKNSNFCNSSSNFNNNFNKSKYFCNYCKKSGHTEDRCYTKRNQSNSGQSKQNQNQPEPMDVDPRSSQIRRQHHNEILPEIKQNIEIENFPLEASETQSLHFHM